MRAMPIQIVTGKAGWEKLKAAFWKNKIHYGQEALGLFIFMVSACFFGSLLEASNSFLHQAIENNFLRTLIMGLLMGSTALFIFYSPLTSSSGSHINPAVTITFLRLGKSCPYDALFFILFQFMGGTIAVILMQFLMGDLLRMAPVNSVVTVPGRLGIAGALITEMLIGFITMSMVLFTSGHDRLKKYTRVFAALFVCAWVILAGPFSGFGMNPARSFASAFASGTWTAFWIYLFAPLVSMLLAAEFYLLIERNKMNIHHRKTNSPIARKKFIEPFEFMI